MRTETVWLPRSWVVSPRSSGSPMKASTLCTPGSCRANISKRAARSAVSGSGVPTGKPSSAVTTPWRTSGISSAPRSRESKYAPQPSRPTMSTTANGARSAARKTGPYSRRVPSMSPPTSATSGQRINRAARETERATKASGRPTAPRARMIALPISSKAPCKSMYGSVRIMISTPRPVCRRAHQRGPATKGTLQRCGRSTLVETPSKRREASMGTTKSATTRDASREQTTASARSPKTCPATPSTKTMGRNTATVVRVLAMTAAPTSWVPRMAAAMISSPSSRHR